MTISADQSLPARFFEEARKVLLEGMPKLDFGDEEILQIADDLGLRIEFERRFQVEAQDPELKRLIHLYLDSVAAKLDDLANASDNRLQLVDRVILAVSLRADPERTESF